MKPLIGIPPAPVSFLLRLEGLAVGIASIAAYAWSGSNWWLYLLVLAPDLSFFGMMLGTKRGAMVYNVAHTYLWPLLLIAAGMATPASLLLPLGLIWVTHIGFDRALGYGFKYPDAVETTHLGRIGRARKEASDAHAA
jgi:hypothetical protein